MRNIHIFGIVYTDVQKLKDSFDKRWMDGWMDGWMDRWMDGRMDRWMDGWID